MDVVFSTGGVDGAGAGLGLSAAATGIACFSAGGGFPVAVAVAVAVEDCVFTSEVTVVSPNKKLLGVPSATPPAVNCSTNAFTFVD